MREREARNEVASVVSASEECQALLQGVGAKELMRIWRSLPGIYEAAYWSTGEAKDEEAVTRAMRDEVCEALMEVLPERHHDTLIRITCEEADERGRAIQRVIDLTCKIAQKTVSNNESVSEEEGEAEQNEEERGGWRRLIRVGMSERELLGMLRSWGLDLVLQENHYRCEESGRRIRRFPDGVQNIGRVRRALEALFSKELRVYHG